jgi:hypothetical protein
VWRIDTPLYRSASCRMARLRRVSIIDLQYGKRVQG